MGNSIHLVQGAGISRRDPPVLCDNRILHDTPIEDIACAPLLLLKLKNQGSTHTSTKITSGGTPELDSGTPIDLGQ